MNCANDYCLYNKDFKCTLDGVNIDSQGHCDDCISNSVTDVKGASLRHQENHYQRCPSNHHAN